MRIFRSFGVADGGSGRGDPKAFQGDSRQAFPQRRPPARDPAAFTGLVVRFPLGFQDQPSYLEAVRRSGRRLRRNRRGGNEMSGKLSGKRIAFLVANEGVEQIELVEPAKAVREAEAEVRPDRARRRTGAGLQPPRQGRHLRARQDRRRGRSRPTTTAWCCRAESPTPISCAPNAGRGRVRAGVLRRRQAGRGDLPRAVDADRGRRRPRPHDHVLAEPAAPTSATPAPSGSTRRSSSTTTWSRSRRPDDLEAFNSKIVEAFAGRRVPAAR